MSDAEHKRGLTMSVKIQAICSPDEKVAFELRGMFCAYTRHNMFKDEPFTEREGVNNTYWFCFMKIPDDTKVPENRALETRRE